MGRGGATTFSMDLQHSDAIMIMGSNMAECHPVAFRWPMKAKAKGAKIIHVDPRFTRTSAMANIYAPLRAGSDIVFLGALVNYIINSQRWNSEQFFKTYVTTYTNAPTLINADYKGPDDLEGLFSGWDDQAKRYTTKSWAYQTEPAATPTTQPNEPGGDAQNFAARVGKLVGPPPIQDRTLQDPQTVFQIMKRHYARYTPELVEQLCGRLDSAHCWRAADPHLDAGAAAARQYRPARRRHSGATRPRDHPGQHRYRHALQSAPRLPEYSKCEPRARHVRRLYCHRGDADGLLEQFSKIHRQPAQGLVWRRRNQGEQLRLRLAAQDHQ